MNLYLRISAVLTLVALALMMWSLLQPTPMPVMIAMTVGQGLGTLAFAAYGYVVFRDLTRKRSEAKSQRLARISQELAIRESQKIARRISQEIEVVKPDDAAATNEPEQAAAGDANGDAEPEKTAGDDAQSGAEPEAGDSKERPPEVAS